MRINEIIQTINQIPWDSNPRIGWWQEQDPLRLYHGTNLKNLPGFAKTGLSIPDPRTGMYSFAFEPFTARAFAVMGGEARFLASKSRTMIVPENQRAVVVFELPSQLVKKIMDNTLSGNDLLHKERLLDKEKYEEWDSTDQQYYQLCELRVTKPVSSNYIVGFMLK
jgi:hypothetical protein